MGKFSTTMREPRDRRSGQKSLAPGRVIRTPVASAWGPPLIADHEAAPEFLRRSPYPIIPAAPSKTVTHVDGSGVVAVKPPAICMPTVAPGLAEMLKLSASNPAPLVVSWKTIEVMVVPFVP
jgi:hypothetical protein